MEISVLGIDIDQETAGMGRRKYRNAWGHFGNLAKKTNANGRPNRSLSIRTSNTHQNPSMDHGQVASITGLIELGPR